MESVDLEVLRQCRDWLRDGHRVVLATIVRTFGSAPRPVGAMLAVNDAGEYRGSVSGGCVEEDLIEQMRDGRFERAQLASFGITAEQSRRHGLPCGGKLELIVETLLDAEMLTSIINAIEQRLVIIRRLNLRNNISRLVGGNASGIVRIDGDSVEIAYGPQWRLLIVGAGDLGRYLAEMALMLGYRVSVCDPRREQWSAWQSDRIERSLSMPDDFVREAVPDSRSVIVAVTHDPKLDDMALLEALPSAAFYIGALGSQRTNDARRQRLAEHFDITPSQLARLHGPVGLPIGSRSAPEIALAILAEVTALRNDIHRCGESTDSHALPAAEGGCRSVPCC